MTDCRYIASSIYIVCVYISFHVCTVHVISHCDWYDNYRLYEKNAYFSDTQTETELNSLGRKVQQLEETFENTEEKLKTANDQLVKVQETGDDSER